MSDAQEALAFYQANVLTLAIDHALLALEATSDAIERRDLEALIADCLWQKNVNLMALTRAEAILADDALHPVALRARGGARYQLRQYEKARADLAKASELRPEDAVLFEFLSCACDELGDEVGRDAAIERLRALGKVPAYLLQLRGEKRLKAGNRDGAEADLRAAAALDDPFAAYLLQANGMSLETGEELAAFGLDREKRNLNPQAVELYREAIAKGFATPERDVAVRARLAYNIGARGNDWAQAALVTTALVEAHPERADAWMHHATVDPQTASYHRAYELDPPTSAAKYARHLAVAGRTEEALAICARHLTERPYDGALRAAQGIALHALGRLDEAKAAWRDAARLGDRSATKLRVDVFGSETGHDSFDLASECMNRRDLSGASRFYAGGRALAQGDCRGRRRGVSVPREEPLQPRIRQ